MPGNTYATNQLTFLSPWFRDVSQARMQSLGLRGGFSGAIVWRVSMGDEELCLRRWPQTHPSMDGLSSIHGLIRHLDGQGYSLAPVPLPTLSGETFFVNEDHLWELTPWMPGEADYRQFPSHAKLRAAMVALADLHRAAASYQYAGNGAQLAPSPGLANRLEILQGLQQGGLDRLWKETRSGDANELRELAFELLEGIDRALIGVIDQLRAIAHVPLPLQWCLRDVRHDHLLYSGEAVTGVIDFGAVAVDSVACDLARLIGSMVNDSAEDWDLALGEYAMRRRLEIGERRAVAGFDAGGTICSAANWVRWLFVDGRSFPQIHALHAQLVWLRDRLSALAQRSGASVASF
ncbi:MAG: phosphotransferase [Planctomycetales bacterium]|nr:phosphotransferase [Planctomycetales bacterium]